MFSGFNILATSAGTPTTTVLATGTLKSVTGGFADFAVSLPVSLGKVLAIEPITPSPDIGWLQSRWMPDNLLRLHS